MELSGFEASVLALIAQNPTMPPIQLRTILSKVGPHAKKIGEAIVKLARADGGEQVDPGDPVEATARAVLEWTKSNRRYLENSRQRAIAV